MSSSRVREPSADRNVRSPSFEPPEYYITIDDDGTLQWDPPAASKELALALSYHFPKQENLEDKMRAAMRRFLRKTKTVKTTTPVLKDVRSSVVKAKPDPADSIAPTSLPQVQKPTPPASPVQENQSLTRHLKATSSACLDQSGIPQVVFKADTGEEIQNASKKRQYTRAERERVGKNRGMVCEDHRQKKQKCDPLTCLQNKQRAEGRPIANQLQDQRRSGSTNTPSDTYKPTPRSGQPSSRNGNSLQRLGPSQLNASADSNIFQETTNSEQNVQVNFAFHPPDPLFNEKFGHYSLEALEDFGDIAPPSLTYNFDDFEIPSVTDHSEIFETWLSDKVLDPHQPSTDAWLSDFTRIADMPSPTTASHHNTTSTYYETTPEPETICMTPARGVHAMSWSPSRRGHKGLQSGNQFSGKQAHPTLNQSPWDMLDEESLSRANSLAGIESADGHQQRLGRPRGAFPSGFQFEDVQGLDPPHPGTLHRRGKEREATKVSLEPTKSSSVPVQSSLGKGTFLGMPRRSSPDLTEPDSVKLLTRKQYAMPYSQVSSTSPSSPSPAAHSYFETGVIPGPLGQGNRESLTEYTNVGGDLEDALRKPVVQEMFTSMRGRASTNGITRRESEIGPRERGLEKESTLSSSLPRSDLSQGYGLPFSPDEYDVAPPSEAINLRPDLLVQKWSGTASDRPTLGARSSPKLFFGEAPPMVLSGAAPEFVIPSSPGALTSILNPTEKERPSVLRKVVPVEQIRMITKARRKQSLRTFHPVKSSVGHAYRAMDTIPEDLPIAGSEKSYCLIQGLGINTSDPPSVVSRGARARSVQVRSDREDFCTERRARPVASQSISPTVVDYKIKGGQGDTQRTSLLTSADGDSPMRRRGKASDKEVDELTEAFKVQSVT